MKNKTTRVLKTAILLAAEAVGENGRGKDELIGYLKFVARRHPKAFVSLLGRLLPLEIKGRVTVGTFRKIPEGATEEEAAALYLENMRVIEGDFEELKPQQIEDQRETEDAHAS